MTIIASGSTDSQGLYQSIVSRLSLLRGLLNRIGRRHEGLMTAELIADGPPPYSIVRKLVARLGGLDELGSASSHHDPQPAHALLKAARLDRSLHSSRPVPRPGDLGTAEQLEMYLAYVCMWAGKKGTWPMFAAHSPRRRRILVLVNSSRTHCNIGRGEQTKVRPRSWIHGAPGPVNQARYGAGRIRQRQSSFLPFPRWHPDPR